MKKLIFFLFVYALAACSKEPGSLSHVSYSFIDKNHNTNNTKAINYYWGWGEGDTLHVEVCFFDSDPAEYDQKRFILGDYSTYPPAPILIPFEGFLVFEKDECVLYDKDAHRIPYIEIESETLDYFVYIRYRYAFYSYDERFSPLLSFGPGYGMYEPPWSYVFGQRVPFTEGHHIIEVPSPEEAEVN